jgi:GT2 family glycosyltransferase
MIAVGTVFYNNPADEVLRFEQAYAVAALEAKDICKLYTINNGTAACLTGVGKYGVLEEITLPSLGNIGFGAAMNVLMREAFEKDGCDVFITANPDGAFHHESIQALIRLHALFPEALIEAVQFPEEHPKVFDEATFETPWASGCCMLIPKAAYAKIGGFDEGFFMYMEDVDLSWRARNAGLLVLTCPFALFYHHIIGRKSNLEIMRQTLLSGRHLGHKWNNASFQQFCEKMLAKRWAEKELPLLPPLFPAARYGVANFDQMFSFAEVRW